MAEYILSAFADEYDASFDEQLKILNKLCVGYLEIRGVDGQNISTLSSEQVKTVKYKLNDNGIKLSSIGSPIGKIAIEQDLSKHFEDCKRIFSTANELDCKNVRMFSFYFEDGKTREQVKRSVFDALEKIVILAQEYGVCLCHENEAKIYGESPTYCKEIVDYFDGKIKCVFDMGNFVLDGYKPYPDAYQLLKENIEYFHVKDSLYAGAIVPAGKGEAQIKEILDAHKNSFDGKIFVTLEPHLQTFDGLNALVGKSFENPYKYPDQKTAFIDGYNHLKSLV